MSFKELFEKHGTKGILLYGDPRTFGAPDGGNHTIDLEDLYQAFKARMMAEEATSPALLDEEALDAEFLKEIIRRVLSKPDLHIRFTDRLEDLGADSLDMIVLVMEVEDKYNLSGGIYKEVAEQIVTVHDLYLAAHGRLKPKGRKKA